MSFAHWIAILFGLGGVLYIAAAVAYQVGARPGMAVAYLGYTLANFGMVWDAFHSVPK